MPDTHVVRLQDDEVRAIRSIAAGTEDGPLLMLNQNHYGADAGYPDGEQYRSYMAILERTVGLVGGKVLWRCPVYGQPLGCAHDAVDEILAIWYPSHAAFLALGKATGADEMLRLRQICVVNAVLHRCPGDVYPLQP